MASTFSPNKNFEEPALNDWVNGWNTPVNSNWTAIDTALGGSAVLNATGLSGNQTLSVAQYRPLTLIVTGTPSAAITYVVPSGVGGQWVFANASTGGQTVGIRSAAGGTTITVPAGQNTVVSCDGSATGVRYSITTPPVAAGTNTQIQYNAAGITAGSPNLTFDGTTLTAAGLATGGNTVLGDAAGDTLAINAATATIPNNLVFKSNMSALWALGIDSINQRVGINVSAATSTLTVGGTIETTAGGIKFPDGSVQTTSGSAPGVVVAFAGSVAPAGALLCDGSAVSRTTYARLFAVISTTYGAGDGSTTFNVPDLRGRVVAMIDGGTGRLSGYTTVGVTGGEQNHTLILGELPAHYHTTDSNSLLANIGTAFSTPTGTGGPAIGYGATVTSTVGSNVGHNTVQPTIALNYIIYA